MPTPQRNSVPVRPEPPADTLAALEIGGGHAPAVARVSIATLRDIEQALVPGLDERERERRCVVVRATVRHLITSAEGHTWAL